MAPRWDALIQTSYTMLRDVQAEASGLVPEEAQPLCTRPRLEARSAATAGGELLSAACAGCAKSGGEGGGTDGEVFGVRASVSAWRIGLDALWWAHEQRQTSYGARDFSRRLGGHAARAILLPNATARRLGGGGLVRESYASWEGGDWIEHAFILGPLAAAMMVRHGHGEHEAGDGQVGAGENQAGANRSELHVQRAAVQRAAELLEAMELGRDSTSDEWLLLGTASLSGALPSLADTLSSLRGRPHAVPDNYGWHAFAPEPPPSPQPAAGYYERYSAPSPPRPPPTALGFNVNRLAVDVSLSMVATPLVLCCLGAVIRKGLRRTGREASCWAAPAAVQPRRRRLRLDPKGQAPLRDGRGDTDEIEIEIEIDEIDERGVPVTVEKKKKLGKGPGEDESVEGGDDEGGARVPQRTKCKPMRFGGATKKQDSYAPVMEAAPFFGSGVGMGVAQDGDVAAPARVQVEVNEHGNLD